MYVCVICRCACNFFVVDVCMLFFLVDECVIYLKRCVLFMSMGPVGFLCLVGGNTNKTQVRNVPV